MPPIHRPYIKMNISKWEIILLMTHLPIIIIGGMYYYVYWHDIPEILVSNNNKWREMHKQIHLWASIGFNFQIMIFGCYYILSNPRNKYWKGRSLSQNLSKARKQYRLETSCLLCNFAIAHILLVMSGILRIEGQIKRIYIPDNWGLIFLIAMLIIWLLHHVMWSKLSDKVLPTVL